MSPVRKLAAFALALAAAVGIGAAVGAAAGPIDTGDEPAHETTTTTDGGDHGGIGSHDGGTSHP